MEPPTSGTSWMSGGCIPGGYRIPLPAYLQGLGLVGEGRAQRTMTRIRGMHSNCAGEMCDVRFRWPDNWSWRHDWTLYGVWRYVANG